LAEYVRPAIPLSIDLWNVAMIAQYLIGLWGNGLRGALGEPILH
jgi:hypothetical protein